MRTLRPLFLLLIVTIFPLNLLHSQWIQTGLTNKSVQAFAVSGTNLFSGTWGDGIFLSTNNGTNWTQINTGLTNAYVNTLAVSGTNLFAGTSGGVFLSTNNGTSWTPANSGLTNVYVRALAVSSTNLFAGTDGSGVFLSTNNGTDWTQTGLSNTYVFALAVSGTNLFAGTTTSGVFLSTNKGTSWTAVNSGLTNTNIRALAVSGTNLFAGTYDGVFLSTNNGSNWTQTSLTNTSVHALAVSGTNLFAGTWGGLFLSSNNGANWVPMKSGLPNTYVFALAVNGTNIFAAPYYAGVFISNNNGASWSAVNSGFSRPRVLTLISRATIIFAGTYDGAIYKSTDNGASWSRVYSDWQNKTEVRALSVSDSIIFAGTYGGVFYSPDNGTSWWPVNSGLTNISVRTLAIKGTSIFAGTSGGVYISTNGGTNWTQTGLTNISVHTLAVSGTNIFTGTDDGVFRSTNNGTSWTQVNTGLSSKNVISLAVSGTNLFAGTTAGGVFLSTNNGTNWTAVNTGLTNTTVQTLTVSGTNLIAGTDGGVFLSTDNGSNWNYFNTGMTANSTKALLIIDGLYLFAGTEQYGVWRRPLSDIMSMAAPTLTSPSDSSTEVNTNTVFSWNASTEAISYQLQITSNPTFTINVMSYSNITSTSFSISGLTNNTRYFWRVNATNPRSTTFYSNVWSFTTFSLVAPNLSTPSNGALAISINPTLTWKSSIGATSYQLQVSRNSNYSTIEVEKSNIVDTSYQLSGLANNTRYYWRINASNARGTCPYSTAWSFTTIPAVVITMKALTFGNVPIGTNKQLTSILKYGGQDTLNITNIVPLNPIFSTDVTQAEIPTGKEISINIRFSPTTTDIVSSMILIFHNLPTSPDTIKVSGLGIKVPIARFSSISISFGDVAVGRYKDIVLTISNLGAQAFQVTNAISSNAVFSVRPTSFMVNPGQSMNDTIRFSPLATGKTSGLFLYLSNSTPSPDTVRVEGVGMIGTDVAKDGEIPLKYSLDQNYPNPFNPSTTIRYAIPKEARVQLDVYDLLGRKQITLVNADQRAGFYEAYFNGNDLPSGLYLYTLTAGEWRATRKILLMK
ncbi:MAG: T9SS type A sorting domain-containing protein [bacterium]